MARALLGHIGNAPDQLLVTEVMRLRRRVAELEVEVARLHADRVTDLHELDSAALSDLELHAIAVLALA